MTVVASHYHHLGSTGGAWKVYIDGKLSDGGMGLSMGSPHPWYVFANRICFHSMLEAVVLWPDSKFALSSLSPIYHLPDCEL